MIRVQRASAVNGGRSFLKVYGWTALAVVGLIGGESRIHGAGTVVGWGYNSNAPSDLTNIVAIASAGIDCLALRSDGTVVAWRGSSYEANVPPDLTNVAAIATSGWVNLALREDGTVAAWGANCCGQTNVPAELTNVIAIAAGEYHNLALRSDGSIVGWGDNNYGESTAPADLTNVVAVACGYFCSFALREDGTVVKWGYGVGTTGPTDLTNVIAIAAVPGSSELMALRADGTTAVWPSYFQSNALTNVVAISFGLALRAQGTVDLLTWSDFPVPDNLTDVIAIAGDSYSCLALVGDGSPAFLQAPMSRLAFTGREVTLQVAVGGDEPLSYQWSFNGTEIPSATNSTLTIPAAQLADAGAYRLAVSNALGSIVSRPMFLAIADAPPSIKTLSTDQLVQPDGAAVLEVVPDGSGPFEIQWNHNGAEIPGATNSSLSISNVTWQDAGAYTVAIANALGSVTSAPVRVFLSFEYPFDAAGPVLWNFGSLFSDPNRSVRQSGGNITYKTSYRESYMETPISLFEWIEVRQTHRIFLTLDTSTRQFVGSDNITETRYDIFDFIVKKVKNLGSTSYSLPMNLPLPTGSDGTWKLDLQVIPSGGRLSGSAQITFPGQTSRPFKLTGSYSPKTGVSKILLQGTGPGKSSVLRLTTTGPNMDLQSLSGRAEGQKLRFP